jgi:hypothetical protein
MTRVKAIEGLAKLVARDHSGHLWHEHSTEAQATYTNMAVAYLNFIEKAMTNWEYTPAEPRT